jgi:serine/threonine protein kinase
MSGWFHKPFGHRKKKGAEHDKRPAVTIKLRKNGGDVVNVTIKSSMMHADVKHAILKALGESKLDIDMVSVYDSAKMRLPCSYDLFLTRESDAKIAKLNKKVFDEILDANTKQECWERALERADIVRYTTEDEKCDIKFQPEDTIFANAAGAVREEATEQLFVKARLADTWLVDSYIQSGSFGRGWNGLNVHTKAKVFIKTFRSYSDRPQRRGRKPGHDATVAAKQEAAIRKEIEVLLHPKFRMMVDHPSVVSNSLCFGSVSVPSTGRAGEMFFIMTEDLCEGGELFNYLCPPEPPYVRSFSEDSARRIFRQIASGVEHLHSVGAYHRDLKLENLVVDAAFNIKIMDFGSVKFTDQMETVTGADGEDKLVAMTYTGVGTGGYKPYEAREQAGTGGYDPAPFDVWSCGIILFYLVAGDVVFAKLGGQLCFRFIELIITKKKFVDFMSPPGVIDPVDNAPSHEKLWDYLEDGEDSFEGSDELKHLINLMLDLDPENRISMPNVLAHGWFKLEDSSDEVYNAEMHSRPIVQGNDQLLDLTRHVKSDEAAKEYVVKHIPIRTDGSKYHIAVHSDEAEVGLSAEGEVLFIIFFGQHQKIMVRWLKGTLADWLEFIFGFKENLGLQASKDRELKSIQDQMASK